MHTAFVIVSLLAAAALTFSATADFVRYEKVLASMTIGAIITHLRARWYDITFPAAYLLLAAGSLGLGLASP